MFVSQIKTPDKLATLEVISVESLCQGCVVVYSNIIYSGIYKCKMQLMIIYENATISWERE